MRKLTDKKVRINLYPFKGSVDMIEAFRTAAVAQDWSKTDIELAVNQTKGLSQSEKFDVLVQYCYTFAQQSESMTQEDVVVLLSFLGKETYYLMHKKVDEWDEYDRSNFHSLERKATRRLKRVFALFDDSVDEKDKYTVQTPPSFFYETHEEALEAVPVGQESITNIFALWIQE